MKIEPDERRMDERLAEVADYLLDKFDGGEHRMVQSVRDAMQENKELRIANDALHDTLAQREQTHSDCRKRLSSKESKVESLKRAVDIQSATIARLTAERDAAVADRDEFRERLEELVEWVDASIDGVHTISRLTIRPALDSLAARPSSEGMGVIPTRTQQEGMLAEAFEKNGVRVVGGPRQQEPYEGGSDAGS
ncbi:MAG: hypothetical protein ACIAQF_05135 [Phycisphaerales bacterium JB065]